MRSLYRLVPLLPFDTFFAITSPQGGRSLARAKVRTLRSPSTCWRCRSLQLSRQYSGSKTPSKAANEEPATNNTPFQARQSTSKTDVDLDPPTAPSVESRTPPTTTSQSARQELPSQEEGRRWHISKRFSHVMDHLQSNIFIAGQRLNDLTGYSGIEVLKREIEEQEELLRTSRASVRNYKDAYSKAITQRSASQREVNELLQRKQNWSNNDLDRFTVLFTSDHANEQAEIAAQEALASAERTAEEANTKLSKSILARYHEEQIWSDKIRRMSTWGTWGLMGVNVLLFLVFQIGVEPWRRKRLVKGFEEKVMEALEREGAANSTALVAIQEKGNQSAGIRNEDQSALPTEVPHVTSDVIEDIVPNAIPEVTPIVAEPEATIHQEITAVQPGEAQSPELAVPPLHTNPLLLKTSILGFSQEYLKDLFSNRLVQLRKLDVTYIALEGAAAGAALVGIVVVLLRPK